MHSIVHGKPVLGKSFKHSNVFIQSNGRNWERLIGRTRNNEMGVAIVAPIDNRASDHGDSSLGYWFTLNRKEQLITWFSRSRHSRWHWSQANKWQRCLSFNLNWMNLPLVTSYYCNNCLHKKSWPMLASVNELGITISWLSPESTGAKTIRAFSLSSPFKHWVTGDFHDIGHFSGDSGYRIITFKMWLGNVSAKEETLHFGCVLIPISLSRRNEKWQ